ncbi:MAG: hypothetical protein HVN35_10430 [Methanobacteriaceae archaeon]|nr:hypothetical protein [Methanobacteriaceae archaeon]
MFSYLFLSNTERIRPYLKDGISGAYELIFKIIFQGREVDYADLVLSSLFILPHDQSG